MMQSPGRRGPAARHRVHREHRGAPRRDDRHQRRRPRAHHPRRRQPRRAPRATSSRPATSSRCARASGGVLVRTGQTEGSVDLARLAGLTPAGVICEIMNEDGTMARMPDLERFAAEARAPHPHDRGPHPVPPLHRAPRAARVRGAGHARPDGHRVARRRLRDGHRRRAAVPRAREGRRRRAVRRLSAGCTPAPRWPTSSRPRRATAGGTCARPSRRSRRPGAGRSSTSPRRGTCARELDALRAQQTQDQRAAARARRRPARCASSASARRCSSTSG